MYKEKKLGQMQQRHQVYQPSKVPLEGVVSNPRVYIYDSPAPTPDLYEAESITFFAFPIRV
jgi:hypothetical protein